MSPDDRQSDRGFGDRGFEDRAFDDRQSDRGMDRGFDDRQSDRGMGRGFDDRNQFAEDRDLEDDAQYADRGLDDRGLEQQLAASGREARLEAGGAYPSVVFAAVLRERLVKNLETTRPPLFRFAIGQRLARVTPLAIALLLFAVAMVGAAQLHIGASDPNPPVVAATDDPTPTEAGSSAAPDPSGGQPIVGSDPTASPTPATTPKPSSAAPPPPPPPTVPTPAPSTGPEALSLSLKGCPGGVVVMWSKYHGGDFNHYTTLRNTSATIPLAYPPQGGAVDFGGTYTTDRFTLSAVDATAAAGVTSYYRTMAFNGADQVVGASSVVSAVAAPMLSLGTLNVVPDAGGTAFSWSPFSGNGGCFTWFKLVASTTNPNPSYLTGDPYLWYSGSTGDTAAVVPDLVSGSTYYLRVQVIRSTPLGNFVAAQSDVATYLVP